MPFKDPEQARRYQREWRAKRRAAWSADKSCVRCGSTDNLELDHIEAEKKVDHKIWSWSEARRKTELEKCQALCHRCHKLKTYCRREHAYGERVAQSVLTEDQVREARELYATGHYTWPQLAKRYDVKHNTLRRACKDFWRHVK